MFSRRDKERIGQATTNLEKLYLSSRGRTARTLDTNRASVLVKAPGGGIPARSGTTLGKADCTIQDIDKSTDGISDGNTLSVYNLSDTAIGASEYVIATRDREGNYIADPGGGVTENVADIRLEDSPTFTEADSGWNLVSDFYFQNVTNQTSSTTTGTDHSWNSVFDPRDSGGTASPLGLRCHAAGTYYGEIPFVMRLIQASTESITFGGVTSTYTEADSSNLTWRAASGSPSQTVELKDGLKFEIKVVIAEEENTTYDANLETIGYALFEIPGFITHNQDPEHRTFTMPFHFSVNDSNQPFEIQVWVNIDTSDSDRWAETSSSLKFEASSNGHRGWIRHISDSSAFLTERYAIATPP